MSDRAVEHHRDLEVTVHDEDDGSIFHIKATPDELVRTVVDRLYSDDLHRERRDGDRLRCEANGDSVFAHLDEHLERYAETHCHELIWLFTGDQGGATA
jgi:hypothetical protein